VPQQKNLLNILGNGIRAEFESRRISPPIKVSLYKDADNPTDQLELSNMKRRLLDGLHSVFKSEHVRLKDIESLDSAEFNLVQIADLFTFTVNRWINYGEPDPQKNA
jgi:hypothetical protein